MTQTLKAGDRGALVALLQLALERAGQMPGALDGIFGAQTAAAVRAFQAANALVPDGIAGAQTHRALLPYYTGFVLRTVRAGDTFSALAQQYGTSVEAIRLANPYLDPERLPIGRAVTVPLPFPVTPVRIPYSSALIGYVVRGLAARYPTLAIGEFGRSVLGKPLWYLTLGSGEKCVFYNAAHHANEWITTPLLLTFCEQLCARLGDGGELGGQDIRALLRQVTLVLAPAVDPDGIDLVTGALSRERTDAAYTLAQNYPASLPVRLEGEHPRHRPQPPVPRRMEHRARDQIRRGLHAPGPRDYVGPAPLTAPESLAMYGFTRALDPQLTLSYHTQGRVIYWQYDGYDVPGSKAIAERFAAASGYAVAETPYASGHAGYKDWFLQDFRRPGFTIEAGSGENPLPLSQFPDIWSDNLGILLGGMAAIL
ncbi:MAG: M14 family zinc carboxypeptidase [Oscillospiraceae bacterium]